MTDNEISKICKWLTKGAKLYIGRDHAGRSKIKVVHGPWGIFTQRYQCDEQDIRALNSQLRQHKLQTV